MASDRSKQQPSPYWTAVPLTRICTTDTYPHDRHGFTRPTPIHTTDTDLHDRPVFTRPKRVYTNRKWGGNAIAPAAGQAGRI